MTKEDIIQLAREAGLSRQAINFLLSGRTKVPTVDTINSIARAFKLPVEEFARAAGLLPPTTLKDALLRRVEEKLARIQDPRDIERIERIIDALAGDDEHRKKKIRVGTPQKVTPS